MGSESLIFHPVAYTQSWGQILQCAFNLWYAAKTMARQARIEYKGALYHLTSRGNAQQDIFTTDEDRLEFINRLRQSRNRYNIIIYAYCLMDNHFHLLVETPEGNVSQFMRHLNSAYTQNFNLSNNRVGHLFQGRFKSILVQKDLYLLELARYIVLNPVRAGMVKAAKDWRWSSYRVTAGLAPPIDWLNSAWLLSQFSKQHQTAIIKYRKFVSEGKKQTKPWKKIRNQILLGSDKFVKDSIKQLESRTVDKEIPFTKIKPREKAKPIAHYEQISETRNEAMFLSYQSGGYSMKEIADYFDVHYSTVSRAVTASCKI